MVFSMAWEFGHQLPQGGTLLPASAAVQVVRSIQEKYSTHKEDEESGGLFCSSGPVKNTRCSKKYQEYQKSV